MSPACVDCEQLLSDVPYAIDLATIRKHDVPDGGYTPCVLMLSIEGTVVAKLDLSVKSATPEQAIASDELEMFVKFSACELDHR